MAEGTTHIWTRDGFEIPLTKSDVAILTEVDELFEGSYIAQATNIETGQTERWHKGSEQMEQEWNWLKKQKQKRDALEVPNKWRR